MYFNIKDLLTLGAFASPAYAYWRMTCPGRLVDQRADPIINPGVVSGHVHTIAGGNGFGLNMTYDQARSSKCTSCTIKEDFSNYWTPKLYFHGSNGSFTEVPQLGDGGGKLAGMTVYYQQRPGPNNDKLQAFPRDFRMVAGDPTKRNFTGGFDAQAVQFVCLGLDASDPNAQINKIPYVNCPDGLRAQIYFPSCWDGKNLDSPDHRSHMAYPSSGSYDNGPCPSTHPVHLISIFYEIIYDINSLSSQWTPNTGTHPWVFAQGDPTGYGFHGDFVNGWDIPTLSSAVADCNDPNGIMQNCPHFTLAPDSDCQACLLAPQVPETVSGTLPALPGCNPVAAGPGPAPIQKCAADPLGGIAPPPPSPSQQTADAGFTDVTGRGFAYAGCGTDNYYARTLTGASNESDAGMSVEACVDFCKGKAFAYAGLEYSTQCYCGNDVPADKAPKPGVLGPCSMKCSGNQGEICGGSAALSLYKACAPGGPCTNAGGTAAAGSKARRHLGRHK